MTQSIGTYQASRSDVIGSSGSSGSSGFTAIIWSVLFFVVLLFWAVFYSLSFFLQLLVFAGLGSPAEADVDSYDEF